MFSFKSRKVTVFASLVLFAMIACTQQNDSSNLSEKKTACFTQKEIPFAAGAIDPIQYTLPTTGADYAAAENLANLFFWYLPCTARIDTPKACLENQHDSDLHALDAYLFAKNFNLSNGELVALRDYTYSGAGLLNNPLWRDRSTAALAPVESRIKTLISALNKLSIYGTTDDELLYRGTSFLPEQITCLQQNLGKTFYHPAFLSASLDEKVARGFGGSALVRIHNAKSGHEVSRFALAPAEEEVLFVPGIEFRIDAIQATKNAQGRDEYLIDISEVSN